MEETVEKQSMRNVGQQLGNARTKEDYEAVVKKRAEVEKMASEARLAKARLEKEQVFKDSNSSAADKKYANLKYKELRGNEPKYRQRTRQIIDNYEEREKQRRYDSENG